VQSAADLFRNGVTVERITLSKIAEMAGVSRQVVSAVLGVSGSGSVRYSPDTAERVMEIVRKTNFRPNRTAMNLVRKQHGAIGVLVRGFGHIPERALHLMLSHAHHHGQVLILDALEASDESLPVFLREDLVDGLAVFEDIDKKVEDEITRLGIPCVRVNTNVRGLPGCITYDEHGGMKLAVDHLVERKRMRLGFLAGPSAHYSMRARLKGFEKAAKDAGAGPIRSYTLRTARGMDGADDTVAEELRDLLVSDGGVDGVVLAVDGMAPAVYRAAAILGLRIPDDLAVVGVNNSQVATSVFPQLTSVYVDPREVGKQTVLLLNRLISGNDVPTGPLKLAFRMIIRASTGAQTSGT
jgi:DNA-binding LacI/PurR family transcriptional regulator